MRISNVSKPLAAFGGVGAREGHDLRPRIHHFVKKRRNDLLICDVHADHIVVLLAGRKQPFRLILGGCPLRRHVLVGDGDSPVQVLPLGLFHPKSHSVPPGVDGFIGEVKIVMAFFGTYASSSCSKFTALRTEASGASSEEAKEQAGKMNSAASIPAR